GELRHGERIPLSDELTGLHPLALHHLELGAVGELVALTLAARVIDDEELTVAVHDHELPVLALNGVERLEAHGSRGAVLEAGLLGATLGRTTDVEGPHRELGARLTDGLGGDDADRLTDGDLAAAGEVTSVALHADAAAGGTGEHRADADLVQTAVLDLADLGLVDLLVRPDEHLARNRVVDVVERHAAQDALAERLDDLTALDERADVQAVHGAAVVLVDDGVLRHVDETAGEVTGVRGLERGVRQTLTGAVGGDEVLLHRETLTEVRRDGGLDDLTRGLGHQTAHTGELTDLLGGTTRTRVGHDVHGVEARLLAGLPLSLGVHAGGLLLGDLGHHLRGDLLGGLRPDVDDLVVALSVGDQTLEVLVLDLGDLGLGLVEELGLLLRDDHVAQGDGGAGACRVVVPERQHAVGQELRLLVAGEVVDDVEQRTELLLAQHLVDGVEAHHVGDDLPRQDAAHGGVDPAAVDAAGDLRLQVHLAVVVRGADLHGAREDAALTRRELAGAGHVVDAEHHVLGRDDDGLAVRRAQDVVGAHHEHAGLHLCLDGERHVHGHLVAVEVRVEGGAHQRVE